MTKNNNKDTQKANEAAESETQRKGRYRVNADGTIDTSDLTPAQLEKLKAAGEAINELQPVLNDVSQKIAELKTQLQKSITDARQELAELEGTPEAQELAGIFTDLTQWRDLMANENTGAGLVWYVGGILLPILNNFDSFKAYIKEINYTGTLEDFIKTAQDPETGESLPSLYDVWESRLEAEAEAAENTIVTAGKRVKNLDYPIDKVNSEIFKFFDTNTHGQMVYALNAEKTGSKKPIDIMYAINFDVIESAVPIVKRLTQYDKRVYIAVGALYTVGNRVISLSQIYNAMGFTGKPGKTDRQKINNSLTKFAARIYIDNQQELAAGYHYPKFKYDGDLLPFERIQQCEINGQVTEAAIHIFREPPLLSFARSRKQITSIPLKMLQSPISKTEKNLLIEDYLIERIARAKNGNQPARILWKTLFENVNVPVKCETGTDYKQQERAQTTAKRFLDFYEDCGSIKNYSTDKAGITINV